MMLDAGHRLTVRSPVGRPRGGPWGSSTPTSAASSIAREAANLLFDDEGRLRIADFGLPSTLRGRVTEPLA